METASKSGKQIVFTGHSSGGATAILATVWYLQKHFITNPNGLPEPRCVTFGAPLVGDYVFKHALGREKWSRFFTNFVTRYDIVPRIMLARKASIEQTLPHVLTRTRDSIQENYQLIAEFSKAVMKDTATVAYRAVCELIGNGEAFLETLSSFLELSPYRPVGTFVFSTGTSLVSVNNSDAILQILFYASQSSNEEEWSGIPYQSMRDHYSYEELVQLSHRDMHHLLLDGENLAALNDLGLVNLSVFPFAQLHSSILVCFQVRKIICTIDVCRAQEPDNASVLHLRRRSNESKIRTIWMPSGLK